MAGVYTDTGHVGVDEQEADLFGQPPPVDPAWLPSIGTFSAGWTFIGRRSTSTHWAARDWKLRAVGPQEAGMEVLYRLETPKGDPEEPSPFRTAVPNWRAGDTIPLGHKELRVIGIRDDDADQPPVLIVEDTSKEETDAAA